MTWAGGCAASSRPLITNPHPNLDPGPNPYPNPSPSPNPNPNPNPHQVRSLVDASAVLQRAAHACGLLSNQRELLAHSYALRLALLGDLFLRVLPLPPPLTSAATGATAA